MNLSANQPKAEVQRLHWNTVTDAATTASPEDSLLSITLKPMEMRTFLISFY